MATWPTCAPPLIVPSALKGWGLPRRQGLWSHRAHLWATSHFAPHTEAMGTPHARPTCGPPVILPLAVKRWGLPRWHGLSSHLAHLWGTFDSPPRSEAVGIPQAAGVM